MTLDEIAKFNETTPDLFIEDIAQREAAKWIVAHARGKVLDFGYGSGIVTEALIDAGFEVTCIEGSQHVYQKIKRCHAICTMFEDFDPTFARFHTVVMSHVLEHIVHPVDLLRRVRQCAERLIVLVPNANSWHRQLAVQMGIQERRDSLSERDKVEGHVRVYHCGSLASDLDAAGWRVESERGFFFKPLPNSMMLNFGPELLLAMNTIFVPAWCAANIGMVCE